MEIKLTDTAGAALRLGVSKALLEKWRTTPDAGPPFCKLGRCVRYRTEDLDLWAAANLTKGGAQ